MSITLKDLNDAVAEIQAQNPDMIVNADEIEIRIPIVYRNKEVFIPVQAMGYSKEYEGGSSISLDKDREENPEKYENEKFVLTSFNLSPMSQGDDNPLAALMGF